MNIRVFFAWFILFSSQYVLARTIPETQAFSLKNGVRVILQEDHSSPSVVVHTMWRTDHTPPKVPGLSHFVLHLLANGESSSPVVSLRSKGMQLSEGTRNDDAGFLATMPASVLPTYLDAERKRYDKLDVRFTTFQDVIKAIEHEVQRSEDTPEALLQRFTDLSFNDLRYRNGHRPSKRFLPEMSAADSLEFFQGNYKASSLTIAIVGDFKSSEVSAQLEKLWSNYPDHDPKSVSFKLDAQGYQEPKRRAINVLEKDICYAQFGYPIPDSRHNDTAALDILTLILVSGDESLLRKGLVQARKAEKVDAESPLALRPQLFTITIIGNEGVPEKDLVDSVKSTIKKIAEQGVSQVQLNQAKKEIIEQFQGLYGPLDQRATHLALYDLYYGSYFSFYGRVEEYSKVTMTDIQRVTSNYRLKEPFLNVLIKAGEGK